LLQAASAERGKDQKGLGVRAMVAFLCFWLDAGHNIRFARRRKSQAVSGQKRRPCGVGGGPFGRHAAQVTPRTSTEKSAGCPPSPAVSRVNMSTRPLGAQVGPSSRKTGGQQPFLDPSVRITPMWNRPAFCLVKAIRSPRGDQTGVP
jgi:hypothetical protein